MTMWVAGWIEVPDSEWHTPGDGWRKYGPRWMAMVDVDPLLNGASSDFGSAAEWHVLNSVLQEGFPPNVSHRVLDQYAADESQRSMVYDPQWASYPQLHALYGNHELSRYFAALLQLLTSLAECFGEDFVRLILWEKL